VVVKDLWLFDDRDSSLEESLKKSPVTKRKGHLEFRCEAYLQTAGGYLPLTYLDTAISSEEHRALNVGNIILPSLFTAFMNKVSAVDIESLSKRRRLLSYHAIDSFNLSRFNYVMDTAMVWRKGVYKNLEEFLNNNPSITDYRVDKNKMGERALYIREANNQYVYTHDA